MKYTKKKQFDQVHITATYYLQDGLVYLREVWDYKDGSTEIREDSEPFPSSNPKDIALRHDWELYPDAVHM